MKRLWMYVITASCIFCISFSACSKGKEGESKKGAIETMTDRAAEKAEKKIKGPIDKARNAQEKESERAKELNQAVKE